MSAISRVSPAYIYAIAIKEFTVLAEFIARHKGTRIEAPGSSVLSLNRAISTKISYGTTVSQVLEKTEETRASDNRHSHFIRILRTCAGHPASFDARRPKTFKPEAKSTDAENIINLYGNLGLFQPCEEFINVPDATPPASGKPLSTVRYKAETPQDDTETLFLFQLPIQDLVSIREDIQDTWTRYTMRKPDLVYAAVTTNAAADIARRLEEDVRPTLDKHGGSEQFMKVLYNSHCMMGGELHYHHTGRTQFIPQDESINI